MQVMVYKTEGFPDTILLNPSPGKGRPPVLLKGITRANLVAAVGNAVTQMRRPKGAPVSDPG